MHIPNKQARHCKIPCRHGVQRFSCCQIQISERGDEEEDQAVENVNAENRIFKKKKMNKEIAPHTMKPESRQ